MPRKRQEPDDVTDIDPAELLDQIIENGRVVFSHDWDSGGLGAGAGSEMVYRWRGKFGIDSLDDPPSGPYPSLEKALKTGHLLTVTSATTEIACSLLSATRLAAMLSCEQDGKIIDINGQSWVYHDGQGFKRVRGRG